MTTPDDHPSLGRGDERRRWRLGAAAAAVVVVLGAGTLAVLGRSEPRRRSTTAAAPTQSSASTAPTVAAPAPARGGDTAIAGGDLGELPDAATLVARVAPALRSAAPSGGPPGAPATPATPSLPSGAPIPPTPRAVGTRPCEMEARDRARGRLGEVLYAATATHRGTPAVVLAFAPAGQGGPVTLEVLAQTGCRLLLEATTP